MQIKNGQKPLSAKKQIRPARISLTDIFSDKLGLDPEIVSEIKAKGLAYRFIAVPHLQKNGGTHEYGWRPYKRECGTLDNVQAATLGSDPDGYIRRGDLVLAVRPQELHEKHRAWLKQEAEAASAVQENKFEEARDLVRGTRSVKVHEGYADPGESEDDNE